MKRIPKSIVRMAIQLRQEQQLSTPQIARQLGICNQSAYKILQDRPWKSTDKYLSRRSWSQKESAQLRRLYPTTPWPALQETFPNRTLGALQKQANNLGVRRDSRLNRKRDYFILPLFEQLRQARLIQRMTLPQLAKKIGYHRGSLCLWEIGKIQPSFFEVNNWASGLGFVLVLHKKEWSNQTALAAPDRSSLMAGRATGIPIPSPDSTP